MPTRPFEDIDDDDEPSSVSVTINKNYYNGVTYVVSLLHDFHSMSLTPYSRPQVYCAAFSSFTHESPTNANATMNMGRMPRNHQGHHHTGSARATSFTTSQEGSFEADEDITPQDEAHVDDLGPGGHHMCSCHLRARGPVGETQNGDGSERAGWLV